MLETTLEEAVGYLEEGGEITLECNDYSYEISPSDNWIGGDVDDGYISLVLGNVIYNDAENIIRKSIDHLSSGGKEVKIFI